MIPLNIRPSASNRWINCAGYPRVQTVADALPDEPEEDYATEGTTAHAWLEFYLGGTDTAPETSIPDDDRQMLQDIAEDIRLYAEVGGYTIETEKEFEICFEIGHTVTILAHADVVLRNATDVIILDLKWGAGRRVSVTNNSQLMLYLLGAVENSPTKVENCAMGIIQPRTGDGWNQVTVPLCELVKFRARALAAITAAYQDTVEYTPGGHCWKCPGRRGLCPAILSSAVDSVVQVPPGMTGFTKEEVERIMFKMFGGPAPFALLDRLEDAKAFLTELDKYATTWLKTGRSIPGWGLETQNGRRKWADPSEVAGALAQLLGGSEAEYLRPAPANPITLGQAEALAKKKGVKINGLIDTPTKTVRVKTEKMDEPELGFTAVE